MSKTWLTQEAADRLAAELAHLETSGRSEIVKKIESARAEGDLKENGGVSILLLSCLSPRSSHYKTSFALQQYQATWLR